MSSIKNYFTFQHAVRRKYTMMCKTFCLFSAPKPLVTALSIIIALLIFKIIMFTSCVDPLLQTNAHPGVTFFDEPEMHEFTSDGGHADFDNGVEVTVPTSAVTPGSTVHITVQPSLAPRDVFVLPEGIASASPSYLISGEGLSGEVTLSMEHHVQVTSNEDANNLVFLQADPSPKRSGAQNVYKYHEVPVSSSQFTPGENNGILRRPFSKKQFIKVGFRKTLKKLFRGD